MKTGQRYFGMTLAQIGILAALALVACIVIGILGTTMLNFAPAAPPVQPTYTLQPSPTVAFSPTPWPTITPIPDWQEYSFADNQARIWLPANYIGGDTVTSSEMIMEKLKATFDDEAFASDIQGLMATPEISFFAFDTEFTSAVRFMFIGKETLSPDLVITLDDYLNHMVDNSTDGSTRLVERQVAQQDYYSVGKLVVESKIPAEDVEVYVTIATYVIQVDNTMWSITFRTGREEFGSYRSTIESIANSFWIQR
ncbi:MAG: hypothetical protein JW963_15240 [Anaerolineales bacterium]|nr:hypothetical protein [Anaerolineales bacterium]